MLKGFILGSIFGVSLIVISLLQMITPVHINRCYITSSGSKIVWGMKVAHQHQWIPLQTTDSYDFLIVGRNLESCNKDAGVIP